MKKTIAIVALSLSLTAAQARADEHRGGDAALGALSGAVVFGTIGPSLARPWATPPGHRLPIPGVSDARIRPRGGRDQRDRTPPRCPALPPRQRRRRQPRFPSRHREPPPRRPPSRASNSASAHRAANSQVTGAKRLNFNRDLGTRFRRSAGLKKKSSCSNRTLLAPRTAPSLYADLGSMLVYNPEVRVGSTA